MRLTPWTDDDLQRESQPTSGKWKKTMDRIIKWNQWNRIFCASVEGNSQPFLSNTSSMAMRVTLSSTIQLAKFLLNECKCEFVLTGKFKKGCLEVLFFTFIKIETYWHDILLQFSSASLELSAQWVAGSRHRHRRLFFEMTGGYLFILLSKPPWTSAKEATSTLRRKSNYWLRTRSVCWRGLEGIRKQPKSWEKI